VLVALLLGVAAVTWGVLQIMLDRGEVLPPLTWTHPASSSLLAIVVLATALGLRARWNDPGSARTRCRWPGWPCWARPARTSDRSSAASTPATCWCCSPGSSIASRRDRSVLCLVALLASVGLSVAGLAAGAGLPGAAVRHR
jgi:hypothetical protein